ncbi:hypothetical protein LY78DRAFT_280104 [Colletotrichum sublineola]|nr:hypothetical protein LY78DRAFT_280104 [Colletotrichum sublineola]
MRQHLTMSGLAAVRRHMRWQPSPQDCWDSGKKYARNALFMRTFLLLSVHIVDFFTISWLSFCVSAKTSGTVTFARKYLIAYRTLSFTAKIKLH